MFFHQAGSCQMEGIVSLYNYITTYLVGILFTVTTALFFIIFIHLHGARHIAQFRSEKNINELVYWIKYLQKWTHSTGLELVWTIIPTIILIAIAVPSFILLYSLDEIVDTQCVVKVIAYQWYWKYEYPVLDPISQDILTFSYLSYMLPLEDLTEEDNLRLLEVDTPLVLPTNVNSKLVITSKDVIHSFAVPALGIKMDAVPGRLNQVTVHIFKSGTYYGQCSELCGVNHAFMPIVVNAVDFATFERFLKEGAGFVNDSTSVDNNGITTDVPLLPFTSYGYISVLLYEYAKFLEALALQPKEEIIQVLTDFRPYRNELIARIALTLDPVYFETNETEDVKAIFKLYKSDANPFITTETFLYFEYLLLEKIGLESFYEYMTIPENVKIERSGETIPFFNFENEDYLLRLEEEYKILHFIHSFLLIDAPEIFEPQAEIPTELPAEAPEEKVLTKEEEEALHHKKIMDEAYLGDVIKPN